MKHLLAFAVFLVLLLGILAACGGSGPSAGSREVHVNETEFKITSSVTTFLPGIPYHFVVNNTGKTVHEFVITPSAMSMNGMPMEEMHKLALVHIETLSTGETKTVDYTFPSSTAGTHPEFACHLPGHYEAGMKQEVTVTS